MDDMDFTKPQPVAAPASGASAPFKASGSPFYDSSIASKIFKDAGRAESFASGAKLFVEDQKAATGGIFSQRGASRMYYVAEGKVALSVGGKPLDTAEAGDVIGEMAVISERPRSATATARTDCSTYSMNGEELNAALARAPEFAIMLMSITFDRLRFMTALLSTRKLGGATGAGEPPVFDATLLARLEESLPRSATTRYWPDSVIMREGQKGAYMYVVKSGSVAISVRDKPVAVVSPGGTFGEMALVDQSPRSATATAKSECELLSIDRASLIAAVKTQPEFAMAMLRAYTDRVRQMNARLV